MYLNLSVLPGTQGYILTRLTPAYCATGLVIIIMNIVRSFVMMACLRDSASC